MIELDREKLQVTAEDLEINAYISYSGRGMYGKQCVGVTGDIGDVIRFILEVVPAIDDYAADGTYREEWFNVRSDDFGRDTIFYWPGVRAVKNEESDN